MQLVAFFMHLLLYGKLLHSLKLQTCQMLPGGWALPQNRAQVFAVKILKYFTYKISPQTATISGSCLSRGSSGLGSTSFKQQFIL